MLLRVTWLFLSLIVKDYITCVNVLFLVVVVAGCCYVVRVFVDVGGGCVIASLLYSSAPFVF